MTVLHETKDRREARALHEWLSLANIPSKIEFEITHYEVHGPASAASEVLEWERDWNDTR